VRLRRDLRTGLVRFCLCLKRKLVRDVVFVDVAHVGRGFCSDLLCDYELYVVKPFVRIEPSSLGFLARLGGVRRAAVISREREQRAIAFTEMGITEIFASSGEFVGGLMGSAWLLVEEVVKLPAGGIEGAL